MSRIGDLGERAYINVYRRGLKSRILDQLASNDGTFFRCHERQKKKGNHQEKKPPVIGSNSFSPPQDLSSKKSKKGNNFQVSKDKPNDSLLNKDNELIGSEKEMRIKEGLFTYCGRKHPIKE
ncbi:hypothetical protein O181_064662 [Austropuccinia psidii MF-1]|uniref:Uncharacterized protein n=1 Tax=Austropuccinia psidii MF-1 TaxID=1389203 RepID=A0A9Q3ES07_9BASI|nr:hypothetical protein [Austropuccinia psidii MF-1]